MMNDPIILIFFILIKRTQIKMLSQSFSLIIFLSWFLLTPIFNLHKFYYIKFFFTLWYSFVTKFSRMFYYLIKLVYISYHWAYILQNPLNNVLFIYNFIIPLFCFINLVFLTLNPIFWIMSKVLSASS